MIRGDHVKERGESSAVMTSDSPLPMLGTGARIQEMLIAMRPRQWTKNLVVFIGLVFAQKLFDLVSFERVVLAFVTFCFASSCIYLLNDVLDREKDRQHPVKCTRPLASGRLPVSWAIAAMGILLVVCSGLIALLIALPVSHQNDLFAVFGGSGLLFALVIASYLVLMVCYSIRLKHIVLVDVFVIAIGFVLRIVAGTVVIPVHISPWLYLVTCFLALFLALSKRRQELILLQEHASNTRQILKEYSVGLLDQMITIVFAATIIGYSLYTIQGPEESHALIVTVPFVLYGMFRYLYLVHMRMEGGSPEEVLLRDRHVLGAIILCTLTILVVLYLLPRWTVL